MDQADPALLSHQLDPKSTLKSWFSLQGSVSDHGHLLTDWKNWGHKTLWLMWCNTHSRTRWTSSSSLSIFTRQTLIEEKRKKERKNTFLHFLGACLYKISARCCGWFPRCWYMVAKFRLVRSDAYWHTRQSNLDMHIYWNMTYSKTRASNKSFLSRFSRFTLWERDMIRWGTTHTPITLKYFNGPKYEH